jgi:hypothetical protein
VGGLATAAALLVTYLLLRLTRQEQRAQREEQRSSQARQMTAWAMVVEPEDDDYLVDQDVIDQRDAAGELVDVRVRNGSDEPIYSARCALGTDWSSAPSTKYEEVPLPSVLPPRFELTFRNTIRLGRTTGGDFDKTPPVELLFADAYGQWWRRDLYGGLSEIKDGLPPSGSAHFFKKPRYTI